MSRYSKAATYRVLYGAMAFFALVASSTLGRWSFWHDEGYTSALIQYPVPELIERTARDVHPPLYYLIAKGWALVFGSSIISLRTLSLMAMLGALLILGRFLVRHLKPSLAVPAIVGLVLSPLLIRYAQEARMYALGTFFVALLVVSFSEQILGPKRRQWFWIYTVSLTAIFYTQYFLGLAILGLAIILYLVRAAEAKTYHPAVVFLTLWKKDKWWLGANLLAGVLFVPWLPHLVLQIVAVQQAFWIEPLSLMSFVSTMTQAVFLRPPDFLSAAHWWLGSAALVALLYLLWQQRGAIANSVPKVVRAWPVLFFAAVVSLAVLSLPPLQSLYHSRYLVPFAPYIYGVLGVAIFTNFPIGSWRIRVARLVLGFAFLIGLANAIILGNNYDRAASDAFSLRALSVDILSERSPQDIILAASLATYFESRQYFEIEQSGRGTEPVFLYMPRRWFGQFGNASAITGRSEILRYPDQLCALGEQGVNIWVVETRAAQLSLIPSTWQLVGTKEAGYAKVRQYQKMAGNECQLVSSD